VKDRVKSGENACPILCRSLVRAVGLQLFSVRVPIFLDSVSSICHMLRQNEERLCRMFDAPGRA